jgi:2-enoate reductase
MRGHQVTIYEKSSRLGGYLPHAAAFARLNTKDVLHIGQWLRKQVQELKIPVALDQEVTPELVSKLKPDGVVLATGSKETLLDVPGIDSAHVGTLDEYLSGKKRAGKNIVVIGGHYGAEIAVSLAREGKSQPEGYTKYHKPAQQRSLQVEQSEKTRQVTILEEGPMVGWPPYFQMLRYMVINEFLAEAGVQCLTKVKVEAVEAEAVVYTDSDGKKGSIKADTVIVALRRRPNRDLYQQLVGNGVELYEIGDCAGPEKVEKAIHMANYLARQL